MAEGEGSSFVEADGPYSRAAYVEEPAIPHYLTLHEKTPAVQQIRTLYDKKRWEFTYWHLALFYMFSEEDLAELIRNPEEARKYGDAAKLFGILFTSGRIPSTYKLPGNPAPPASAAVTLAPPSASIPLDVSPGPTKTHGADEATRGSLKRKFSVSMATGSLKEKVTKFVKRAEIFPAWRQPSSSRAALVATHKRRGFGTGIESRDREECVVTHKSMAFDRAHIVPFSVNSTGACLDYVPSALNIAERLLGVSFRQKVEREVGTLGGSDFPWNIIILTPYLHRLWDNHGVIGFRPRYIDAERSKSGEVVYFATFTFHWLPKIVAYAGRNVPLQLSADDCLQMVSERLSFSIRKDRLFETVYTPGRQPPNDLQRLEDGHVCRVRFEVRSEAESMMRMLDLRWQASRLLCLSGGAEEDFLDPPSDDDSDSDGYPNYRPWVFRPEWGSDDDEAA